MNKKQDHSKAEGSVIGPFIQKSMGYAKVQTPRADEMSQTVQSEMKERLEKDSRKSRRQTKLAVMGIPTDSLNGGDVRYARCVRLAAAYRKVRARELQVAHGYVSAGSSALLATASLALAASRFLYEKATEAGPDEVAGLLKHATQLADSARANELAAWELCAREAVQRKKAEASSAGVPWIVTQQDRQGQRGRGRPRKEIGIQKEEVPGLLPAMVLSGGTDGQRPIAQGHGEGTQLGQ